MAISAPKARLLEVPLDKIQLNPENPRIFFRQGELNDLMESIRRYGVQVPISVFREGLNYTLIDGERRWRCCRKLNMKTIPALIQQKPDPLTNLLLMFNIHALREQWDLLTIALKLPRVITLLGKKFGREPNEAELSNETGLTRGLIRRCRLLMELPDRYKNMILKELEKPKAKQRITEDLFIEMERALKTVERAMPDVLRDRDAARQVLLTKYEDNVIPNIVHFRMMAKIARAENVEADPRPAKAALQRLFSPNRYSIEQAYGDTVYEAYLERDVLTRINALIERLNELATEDVDDDLRHALRELTERARSLLGGE